MIKKLSKQVPIYTRRMLDLMENHAPLSTKEWCEKIGISPTNLPGYRQGTRSFTTDQMIRAARLHNTTIDYICGLTARKMKPEEKLNAIEMIEEGLRILKDNKVKNKVP